MIRSYITRKDGNARAMERFSGYATTLKPGIKKILVPASQYIQSPTPRNVPPRIISPLYWHTLTIWYHYHYDFAHIYCRPNNHTHHSHQIRRNAIFIPIRQLNQQWDKNLRFNHNLTYHIPLIRYIMYTKSINYNIVYQHRLNILMKYNNIFFLQYNQLLKLKFNLPTWYALNRHLLNYHLFLYFL